MKKLINLHSHSYFDVFLEDIKIAMSKNKLGHNILLYNLDEIDLLPLIMQITSMFLKRSVVDLQATPDVFYLFPNGSNQIKLEEVRSILEKCRLTIHPSYTKVVIINPIEALNIFSCNFLLKILEEPPRNTYFLFIGSDIQFVNPTLRSRLQVRQIFLTHAKKVQYLAHTYGMDRLTAMKALKMTQGNLSLISAIKSEKFFWSIRKTIIQVLSGKSSIFDIQYSVHDYYLETLHWITSFIIDLYHHQLSVEPYYNDYLPLLITFSKRFSLKTTYDFYQRILRLQSFRVSHLNINKQVAIEALISDLLSLKIGQEK